MHQIIIIKYWKQILSADLGGGGGNSLQEIYGTASATVCQKYCESHTLCSVSYWINLSEPFWSPKSIPKKDILKH